MKSWSSARKKGKNREKFGSGIEDIEFVFQAEYVGVRSLTTNLRTDSAYVVILAVANLINDKDNHCYAISPRPPSWWYLFFYS
jgi:hypothetical protein